MIPITAALVAALAAVTITPGVHGQSAEWREVDNPYQEDVDYAIGDSFEPAVEIDNVRWRWFRIDTDDLALYEADDSVRTEVTLEVENRGQKSARVLVILLLENEDGAPLDRIEFRPFKVPSSRIKERRETADLPVDSLRAARRVYLFFEIME